MVQLAREKRREREEEGRGGEGGEIGGGVRGFLSNSLVSLWAYPEGEWEEDRKGFEVGGGRREREKIGGWVGICVLTLKFKKKKI